MNQYVIAEILKGGAFDRHLRTLRTSLKNQVANTAPAIARYFPKNTRISAPKGGLTLWVELDSRIDGVKLFHAARKQKIRVLEYNIGGSNFVKILEYLIGFLRGKIALKKNKK